MAARVVSLWALYASVAAGATQCVGDQDCALPHAAFIGRIDSASVRPAGSSLPPPPSHVHVQDMVAMLITVCMVFCSLLAFVILKKPVPRLLDAIPREALCWSHSDNLFVFTDLESDSIMIKNAGLSDIELSGCKLRIEHATDRGIYYNFSFPEGYLLVAGTTVSVCYRTAAKFVAIPRRRVDRLDSRTCPRLRWPPHNDGPVDSDLDSASLFDSHGNQIACESAVLQAASFDGSQRRLSTDSSDASFLSPTAGDLHGAAAPECASQLVETVTCASMGKSRGRAFEVHAHVRVYSQRNRYPETVTQCVSECLSKASRRVLWLPESSAADRCWGSQPMQEYSRKESREKNGEEWRLKFVAETKVNQELGRRLREQKLKVETERMAVEQLRQQLERLTRSQNRQTMAVASCERCATLELEVARLRQLLVKHNIDIPADIPKDIAQSRIDVAGHGNILRRSHSILVRRQSGQIQCLRDVLEDLTPSTNVIEAARRNSRVLTVAVASPECPEPSTPAKTAKVAEAIQQKIPSTTQSLEGKARKRSQLPDNQDLEGANINANLRLGIEDKSLGDLFKYAIVLTGPMARPKKNAFSAFFKNNDFRRSKSLQDGGGPKGDGAISRNASVAIGPVKAPASVVDEKNTDCSTTVKSSPAPPPPITVPTPPLPITVQDFVPPDSAHRKVSEAAKYPVPGSPMKKTGWLSNIVPPRFRAGSTDTPPSPQTSTNVKPELPEPPKKEIPTQPAVKHDPTKPRMLAVSPLPGKDGVAELEGLLEICFPYGDKLPPLSDFSVTNLRRTLQERHRTYRSPDSTFVLTIASVKNPTEITYAVCVHLPLFPDDASGTGPENVDAEGEKLPSHGCISILSNYPFFSLFFKVVFGIASIWESRRKEYVQDYAIALKEKKAPPTPLTIKDFVDHFDGVMNRMKEMRVPPMGGWTRLVLAPQYTPLAFHRPHSESVSAERRMLVLEYAAPMLFAQLSVDQVLFLLGCLCCERKVLVVSDHANIVSSCVLALTTLLQPLQWAGPVITLLPPRLDELLEAPVPLIAGRVSINSASIPSFSTLTKPMNGVIEMNMDQNNLCMHEEDLMLYHELKLPGCDALVHELQHLSSLVFERHLSPDFPSIEQIQACDTICSRIHRHMETICALATGEATSLDVSSPLYCASPRRQAGGSASDPVWTPRCSEAVQDYIRRFQDTQMFSMFKLQRQEEREQEELADDDDADGDDESDGPTAPARTKRGSLQLHVDDSSDDDGDDGDVVESGDSETLLVEDEAVTYETAAT